MNKQAFPPWIVSSSNSPEWQKSSGYQGATISHLLTPNPSQSAPTDLFKTESTSGREDLQQLIIKWICPEIYEEYWEHQPIFIYNAWRRTV
jgi:hypothetical protein